MQAVLDQPEVEGHRQIISLSQDSFYKELSETELKLAKKRMTMKDVEEVTFTIL